MIVAASSLMQIDLAVGKPIDVGSDRRCIPITGGTVSGQYTGHVIDGGADWQQIRADGTIEINARYVLRLTEGLVEVASQGLRAAPADVLQQLARGEAVDPSLYYFRTAICLRTVAPALDRLNRILAVSSGERLANTVRLSVYEVA